MGDNAVGKTLIIQTFVQGKKPTQLNRTAVIGDYSKVMETDQDQKIKLEIWDATGDSKIGNLVHLFLRDVQVAVLVFRIDEMRSFDSITMWAAHLQGG